MREIRVLVLSHMYPRNTHSVLGIFVQRQMRYLLREGCQVSVISPVPYAPPIFWNNPKWKGYRQSPLSDSIEGIPVFYPRYLRGPGKWFHGISSYTIYQGVLEVVDSLVKKFRPHVLHAYTATPDGYTGLLLRKRYHLPVICTLLGSDINTYPSYRPLSLWLTENVISEADRLVAVSGALKSAAEAIARPKREIQVVYMGCDLGVFAYDERARSYIREQLKIASKDRVLLFLGSTLRTKGIFELLEAFTQLVTRYPDLHLIFVGGGSDRLALAERVSETRLNRRVHLVGSPPHDSIPGWLSAADVFVLPSYSEGLPLTVLEAMACARPVVATRVGGIPEAVEDARSGILVDQRDVEALLKAIALLLDDEGKRESMGALGRRIVESKFTWEKNAEKTIKIYQAVLNER